MAGGLAVITGDNSIVAVKGAAGSFDTAGAWWNVPGIASWAEGGGDTPTRDIVAFEGVSSQSGRARVQTVECEVSAYAPRHRAWRLIREALIRKSALEFRLRTQRQVILSSAPSNLVLDVSAAGAASFDVSGGEANVSAADAFIRRLRGSEFAAGMVLEYDGGTEDPAFRSIEDIPAAPTRDAAFTIAAPAAAIDGAAAFRITVPSLERVGSATVAAADRTTTRAEGDLSAGLSLTPLALLSEYAIVDAAEQGALPFTA